MMTPFRGRVMPTADDKQVPYLTDESVGFNSFVPHSFALEKLKIASTEYFELKTSYENYIIELKGSHSSHCQQTQLFYENYIKDMKGKAKMHVEGQIVLKQEMLNSLRLQLVNSEEVVERLRDQLTDLRLTFQEDAKSLRSQLVLATANEAALQKKELDSTVRSECAAVVSNLLVQIEVTLLSQEYSEQMKIAADHVASLRASAAESATAANEQNTRLLTELEVDRECKATMLALLHRIEDEASQDVKARFLLVNTIEQEMRGRCEASEESALSLTTGIAAAEASKAEEIAILAQSLHEASEGHIAAIGDLSAMYDSEIICIRDENEGVIAGLNRQLGEMSKALTSLQVHACVQQLIVGVEMLCFTEAPVPSVILGLPVSLNGDKESQADLAERNKLKDQLGQAVVQACIDSIITEISDVQSNTQSNRDTQLIAHLMEDSAESARIVISLEQQVQELLNHIESMAEAEEQQETERSAALAAAAAAAEVIESKVDPLAEAADVASLRLKLAELDKALLTAQQAASSLGEKKTASKALIVGWVSQFQKDNGRPPLDGDKEAVRPMYQAYKGDTKRLKSAVAVADTLSLERAALAEKLSKLGATMEEIVVAPIATIPVEPSVRFDIPTSKGEGESIERPPSAVKSPSFSLMRATSRSFLLDRGPRAEDVEIIEGLEDKVYQLQQDLEKATLATEMVTSENALLARQLDTMTKEKRTDVVKRFENEIQTLQTQDLALQASVTQLKASQSKNEAKISELKDRAERAEHELKERDATEQKGLSPSDERAVLKTQVGKQRDDIVLKAKAATAGWNAAASADERLDLDVDKAYRRGKEENHSQHVLDMKNLNESLGVKETRITDLLVEVNTMERRMREAEENEKIAVELARVARQEAMEAIATFGAGDVGGGGGASEKEVDSIRDALDAAQEEVVLLSEKCDGLSSALIIARQKGSLLEQLVSTAQANTKVAQQKLSAAQTNAGNGAEMGDLLAALKGALIKGAALAKNNRKDECFDLWSKTCDDALLHLRTPALRTLIVDGLQQGKAQSLGGQKKERGSVVLKKTLDRLVGDLQQPHIRKAEEDTASDIAQQEMLASEDAASQGLMGQLAILEKQEDAISNAARLEEERRAGGEDASGATTAAQSGSSTPSPSSSMSSSLLKRAKEAEAKVETLKRQMVAMVQDMQKGEDERQPEEANSTSKVSPALVSSTSAKSKKNVVEPKIVTEVAAKGPAVNPAEVRKLQRRINELETQLTAGAGASGLADKKSAVTAANAEKALQRKLKDLESAHRREKVALEGRVARAEATLEVSSASLPLVTAERDQLRVQVKNFRGQEAEIAALKGKGAECDTLTEQLEVKGKEFDLLAEQFKKESALRKKYKNELEDLKGAIRVYARCRPMVNYEREKGCKQVVEFVDETSLKIQTSRGEREYEMDTVFDQRSKQEEVFEDTRRLVESFMDGFNVCLFAYGQTGSGKTFTMTGSASEPGLTPRAVGEIFRLIEDRKHCDCKVTAYFVELYNDQLVDLLWLVDSKEKEASKESKGQPPHLDIKLDGNKMVYVKGSVVKEAGSTEDLLELFTKGNAERHTGATNMNAESSRSHSIFSIMVESYDRNTKRIVRGKLSLVDLAGSERAEKTGGNAERLKEGQSINKSLSALGDVMAALSEGGKAFVPYRNNKLTQLMQDSLGGNAKTLMFVNFSPADYNADETVTSLNFAARVKKIVNNASKQAESDEVTKLKAAIKRLQDKISGGSGAGAAAEEEGDDREGDDSPDL